MRLATRQFREQAEAAVYEAIHAYGPFMTKPQLMRFSGVDGTAFKRVIATLIAAGEVEVLRTTEFEDGEYEPEVKTVYGQAGAVADLRLAYRSLHDQSLQLDEGSSDRVLTMCDSCEARAHTRRTIQSRTSRSLAAPIVDYLTACVFPAWLTRPDASNADDYLGTDLQLEHHA